MLLQTHIDLHEYTWICHHAYDSTNTWWKWLLCLSTYTHTTLIVVVYRSFGRPSPHISYSSLQIWAYVSSWCESWMWNIFEAMAATRGWKKSASLHNTIRIRFTSSLFIIESQCISHCLPFADGARWEWYITYQNCNVITYGRCRLQFANAVSVRCGLAIASAWHIYSKCVCIWYWKHAFSYFVIDATMSTVFFF